MTSRQDFRNSCDTNVLGCWASVFQFFVCLVFRDLLLDTAFSGFRKKTATSLTNHSKYVLSIDLFSLFEFFYFGVLLQISLTEIKILVIFINKFVFHSYFIQFSLWFRKKTEAIVLILANVMQSLVSFFSFLTNGQRQLPKKKDQKVSRLFLAFFRTSEQLQFQSSEWLHLFYNGTN